MIVDDEPLMRSTIHQMFVWKELDMEIVAEVSDGAEALAVLQERNDIDILLMKQPIPIVLSAYRDCSYVCEAFLLGAYDYIVIVDMDESHILPVLQKVRHKLKELDVSNDMQMTYPVKEVNSDPDHVIAGLFSEGIQADGMEYYRIVDEVCNWLGESNQVAVAVSISSSAKMISKKLMKQTIQTEMNSALFKHFVYCEDANEIFILLTVQQLRSEMAIRELIHTTLSIIKTRLEQCMNVRVAMGISEILDGRKHWLRLLNQARSLVALSFFEGYGRFFYPESAMKTCMQISADLRMTLKAKSAEIVRLLQLKNEMQWELEFDLCMKILEENVRSEVHETRLLFTDFLWELSSLLYAHEVRWGGVFDRSNPFEQLKDFHTLVDTLQWIKQVCSDIYHFIHELSPKINSSHSIVEKAREFIHQHYCEELSLGMVSQWVGVTETYLSRIFTQNVGECFTQYVTKLRIEESKRLLKMGYKIMDLSEKIGYTNPEHFSRVFKRVTGVSPKFYKESLD
ncbi:response regulator transcription factor [Paenibacillus aestuarii]|uniref:Helix-turn-helix domain-containing protein n=1 Tax=Paenibacillus aestuarii TaxID=516965 RepID=A0ABW0K9N5_9BACL|nr:helix-turn-helix domain-containing protein [Paenibacillus aestuarii]